MKIALGCDHGAFAFKAQLKDYLIRHGHSFEDFGTNSADSCDYPDYGLPAVQSVADFRERAKSACLRAWRA